MAEAVYVWGYEVYSFRFYCIPKTAKKNNKILIKMKLVVFVRTRFDNK